MSYNDTSRCGAIICTHISDGKLPILRASRDEPLEPLDSGWQFTCGVSDHDAEDAALWLVEEVVQLDPSIRAIIDSAPGIAFERASLGAAWQSVGGA